MASYDAAPLFIPVRPTQDSAGTLMAMCIHVHVNNICIYMYVYINIVTHVQCTCICMYMYMYNNAVMCMYLYNMLTKPANSTELHEGDCQCV